ncbi:hypothetical protein KGM_210457A, partial [Danaus plexippus plexippus]
MAKLL